MNTTLNFKFVTDGNITLGKRMMIIGRDEKQDKYYPVLERSIDIHGVGFNDHDVTDHVYDSITIQEDSLKENRFERSFSNCKIVGFEKSIIEFDNGFKEVVKTIKLEFEDEF